MNRRTLPTESVKVGKPILARVRRRARQEGHTYRLMLEILLETGLALRPDSTHKAAR